MSEYKPTRRINNNDRGADKYRRSSNNYSSNRSQQNSNRYYQHNASKHQRVDRARRAAQLTHEQQGSQDRSRTYQRQQHVAQYEQKERYVQRHQKSNKKVKRIISALITILIVLVLLFVFNPLGCNSQSNSSSTDNTSIIPSATKHYELPTPIMAESNGLYLHCAVSLEDLTEILIHNASYDYACPLTTQLIEATNTEVMENHGTGNDMDAQPNGDNWMQGQFIRCYRSGNGGPKMSAIDCGAAVGSVVYAPVSGTVVKVKKYKLYNNPNYNDYEIHIQPDGYPNLDVVLIHLTDVTISQGDEVVAGETSIAKVRDVYAYIGNEMQLKAYTAEDDNGNHTHIQVNDKTNPNYHGLE